MRSIRALSTLKRAFGGRAAVAATSASSHRYLFQADDTCTPYALGYRSAVHGVGGIRFLSVAAAGAAAAAVKEVPHSAANFHPKDVVLYQYEACPFCNKVKGSFSVFY